MTKTFCDNCGKEVQDASYMHVHSFRCDDQEEPLRIAVDFSFVGNSAKPELCLSCQAKFLREFADMVEQGL